MSIAKKLPAVLIAAVGFSFSFAGTALAEEPIFAEPTLGPRETLRIIPPDRRNTSICYKATDNLEPSLAIIAVPNPQYPTMIFLPDDIRMQGLKVIQESDHQCISINVGYVGTVTNIGDKDFNESQSLHVYARQYRGD